MDSSPHDTDVCCDDVCCDEVRLLRFESRLTHCIAHRVAGALFALRIHVDLLGDGRDLSLTDMRESIDEATARLAQLQVRESRVHDLRSLFHDAASIAERSFLVDLDDMPQPFVRGVASRICHVFVLLARDIEGNEPLRLRVRDVGTTIDVDIEGSGGIDAFTHRVLRDHGAIEVHDDWVRVRLLKQTR